MYKLKKFRLRTLIISCCLVGTCIGVSYSSAVRNSNAIEKLSENGAEFWGGFEDPPGPNFLYGVENSPPPNGYFWRWFSETFCSKGYSSCEVFQLSEQDLGLLRDLLYLKFLTVNCESLPDGWAKEIGRCRNLRTLEIDIDFGNFRIEELTSLDQVAHLVIGKLENCDNELEFIETVSGLPSLKKLTLPDTPEARRIKKGLETRRQIQIVIHE